MSQVKNIDNQIIGYLGKLSEKKKQAVLTMVRTLSEDTPSLWELMPDEVKKSIETGIAESQKGLGRSHEEVMKKYAKWLKK